MRPGPDHTLFPFRKLDAPSELQYPPGKRVALFVSVPLEFFPLDAPAQPFRPSGSLDRPYPDIWDYAARDYGNRVGIYRLLTLFNRYGVRATAFVDAATARRYPHAIRSTIDAGWELAASGVDRAHLHYGGLEREDEAALITETLDALRPFTAEPIVGWQSPGLSESSSTLDLLAEHGFSYVADWVNDDLPYTMATGHGSLTALPVSFELSDRNVLAHHDFTAEEYAGQVLAAWSTLSAEAMSSPRVLSLIVTPWVLGYPHRIAALRRVLGTIATAPEAWIVTGRELADAHAPI